MNMVRGKRGTMHSKRFEAIALSILYFLLFVPLMSQVSMYHSDELFYTDSAVYMLQHNDLVTPYYPDGTLRFKKPIITYWALMTSYKIFGINYFSTRLPFLIAGCLVIWLTYIISLKLFNRHVSAVLAAIIMASNIQLLTSALRSTPDILQSLFLCISLYGFICLIFNEDTRLRNHLLAYFGSALAIETKGLLGVVALFYVFAYVISIKDFRKKIKNLVHIPVMLIAGATAVMWFVAVYLKHGDTALHGFLYDQGGGGMLSEGSRLYIFASYVWGVFRHFLPWSVMAVVAGICCRKEAAGFLRENLRKNIFLWAWFLMLLLIFINGSMVRTRYLFPAYPLLSIFVAAFLMEMVYQNKMIRFFKWIYLGLLILGGFSSILLMGAGFLIDSRILIAGIGLFTVSLLLYYFTFLKEKFQVLSGVGIYIIAAFFFVHFLVLPVFRVSPSQKLTECIRDIMKHDPGIITVWSQDKFKLTGQINVFSEGEIRILNLPQGRLPNDLYQKPLVILSEKSGDAVEFKDYEVIPCGYTYRSVKPGEIWEQLKPDAIGPFFEPFRRYFYVAKRKK
ncbi:MAG: glycosyltransferase family 39 protein [Desulfobacterales bacterium]